MKKKFNTLILAVLFFAFCGCIKNTEVAKCECENKKTIVVLKDEPAYIVKGYFEYYSRVDSFSIELENYPEEIGAIFPCNEIPKQYRVANLKVLVSGNILNCTDVNKCCPPPPYFRMLPTHIFELTNIITNN